MIQIRETDFLWKCYKRYYRDDKFYKDQTPPMPHPKSVCNFWWTSVGGMGKWLFWDSPFFITAPLLIALVYLLVCQSIEWDAWRDKQVPTRTLLVTLPFGFSIVFSGITALYFLIGRFWCCTFPEWLKGTVTGAVIALVISLLFSLMISSAHKEEWEWIHLFYGFLLLTGAVAAAVLLIGTLYFFSQESPTGKIIRAYIESFKTWACPLVKAPWEEGVPPVETPVEQKP